MKHTRIIVLAAFLGTAAVNSTAQSIIAGGFCGAEAPGGSNLTWYLYSDSTLRIHGSGDMENYASLNPEYKRPWDDYWDKIKTIVIGDSVTSIGDWAFQYYRNVISVTIPSSVISIGGSAFADCTNLDSVTIPNGVTSIRMATFWNCTKLTSITIPESVININYNAFRYCYGLTTVTIPESVINIEANAFANCINLTRITVRAVVPPVLGLPSTPYSVTAFYNVPDTIPIYIPCGSIPAYQADTGWSYFSNFIEEFADTTFLFDTICQGETYNKYGFNVSDSGIHKQNQQNIYGCDSLVCLELVVNPTYFTQISDSIYIGNSYDFHGKQLTEDGIYYDTLSTINGCDSIIELTLTVIGVGIKQLIIDNGQWRIESYEIYNTVGQLIFSQPPPFGGNEGGLSYKSLQSLETLPTGTYIIRITTSNGIITRKIVKQ